MAHAALAANAVNLQAKATPHQQAATMKSQNGLRPNINGDNQNPANASLVSSLHATMTPLAQADHDYNGHRARAMHEINAAIQHLSAQAGRPNAGNAGLARSGTTAQPGNIARPGNVNGTNNAIRTGPRNGAGAGTGTVAGTGTGRRMPQATSDAYLREAHQSLLNVESQLNTNGINPHHFTQAKASVQAAIRELNLALIDR